MKGFAQSSSRGTGFTLVELLVALALAVVITGLVFVMLGIVNTARRGQSARALCRDTVGRVLQQVAGNLERAFVFSQDEATPFQLARGAAASNAVLELSFARTAPLPGETNLCWAEVSRLTYRLVENDLSNNTLYCLSRPLAGPGAIQPAVTNQIYQGLENFAVQLFDGKDWQDDWGGGTAGKSTNAIPRAARLTITVQRGAARYSNTTEVIIPIGMKFEPPKQTKGKDIRDIR